MYSPHKHSYLQSRSSGVNPRIINRTVNLARSQPTIDECDLDPPFLRLCSEQPNIPTDQANVDLTRRPLAFGRWALPKLRRELHSHDALVVLQAITSIMDLVHDPEKGYEAIRLRIPDRIADLLLDGSEVIRERSCMALTVMAGLADGKEMIVKNQQMLANIILAVEDISPVVRIKAAALVEMLSRIWTAADELVWHGFIPVLLDNLHKEEDEITSIHLKSLASLMYGAGKNVALEHNAFDIFTSLLSRRSTEVLAGISACLKMVISTPMGKESALEANILPILNQLLHDERPEVYTAAASAIMFCTILTDAKLKAKHVKNLPQRLLTLARDQHNVSCQVYCVKALTNVCEHPGVRKQMLKNHMDDVNSIPVDHYPELKEYKEILLSVLNWLPETAV